MTRLFKISHLNQFKKIKLIASDTDMSINCISICPYYISSLYHNVCKHFANKHFKTTINVLVNEKNNN